MAKRRADTGRAGLKGGNARRVCDADPLGGIRHTAILLIPVQQFIDQRTHGVDAGITGGNQRDILALASFFQRKADAVLFRPKREVVVGLAGNVLVNNVEIKRVADNVGCFRQKLGGLRCAPVVLARTDTDNGQMPASPADRVSVNPLRRPCNGASCVVGFLLFDLQRSKGTGRGQCRAFRHSVTADFLEDDGRRVFQARGLALQVFCGKDPKRHIQMRGESIDSGLICLEVDGRDAGNSALGNVGSRQFGLDQFDQFGRIAPARAADANSIALRVVDQTRRTCFFRMFGCRKRDGGVVCQLQLGLFQPVGAAFQADGSAGEQLGHDRFCIFRIGETPAAGRGVERNTKLGVPSRRDRRVPTESAGQKLGQFVGAAMTTEQRHDTLAVFRHGDHRRFACLVGQDRCKGPDQNAAGAEADDRMTGLKQQADMVDRFVELGVRRRHTAGKPVDAGG